MEQAGAGEGRVDEGGGAWMCWVVVVSVELEANARFGLVDEGVIETPAMPLPDSSGAELSDIEFWFGSTGSVLGLFASGSIISSSTGEVFRFRISSWGTSTGVPLLSINLRANSFSSSSASSAGHR
jgi:hypothetical protein